MKRSSLHESHEVHKRVRLRSSSSDDAFTNTDIPSDAEASIRFLTSQFPLDAFEQRLPPIIMKHQVYSLVEDKTEADRELMMLKDNGTIRLFKLGNVADEFAVCFTSDYISFIERTIKHGNPAVKIFITSVLPRCKDVSVSKTALLTEARLSEADISFLVNCGLLVVRDIGKAASWWFAIPGVGLFVRHLTKGRSAVLQMIKRAKHQELLQSELEARKLSVSKLGMDYHLRDILGAELVRSIDTTSGPLLRLMEEPKKKKKR
ncbi:inactive serine/threonine-protein kinase 19-like [Dysidea avara]|uniref:inactive serine/threonine-protein kinase 19-like n=1 Tax=Dysidea avara TaxID=196820 RepID=UPI00333007B3